MSQQKDLACCSDYLDVARSVTERLFPEWHPVWKECPRQLEEVAGFVMVEMVMEWRRSGREEVFGKPLEHCALLGLRRWTRFCRTPDEALAQGRRDVRSFWLIAEQTGVPNRQRALARLLYEGFNVTEVARIMGCARPTVYRWLKALRKSVECLPPELKEVAKL